MAKTETPNWLASEELLWLKRDGSEVHVTARVGLPYQVDERTWACPMELAGVHLRVGDILSTSAMQALCMSLSLLRTRLGHLIANGERLVYPHDRKCVWNVPMLVAIFGNGFDFPD